MLRLGGPVESLAGGSEALKGSHPGASGGQLPKPSEPTLYEFPSKLRITNNVLRADHHSYQIRNIEMMTALGYQRGSPIGSAMRSFGNFCFGGAVLALFVGLQTSLALVAVGMGLRYVSKLMQKPMMFTLLIRMNSGSELLLRSPDQEFILKLEESINEIIDASARSHSRPIHYYVDVDAGTVANMLTDDDEANDLRALNGDEGSGASSHA